MEFAMNILNEGINFAKNKIDTVMNFWEELEDDKKKLLIGCAVAAAAVICVASVAYAIGKSNGKKLALEEEDF